MSEERADRRRGLAALERRGGGLVAGLGHCGDDFVHGGAFGVVVDFDARGGEVDLHVLDALETADLLLDLGDAGRAGEPFGPQDSVCGGGGAHGGFPFVVVFPIDTLTIGSFRPELLDADQVRATIAKESLAALATVPLDAGSGRLAPCPRTTCVSLASRSSKDSPTTSSC